MNAEPAILSIGVLAVFALALGGTMLLLRRGDRKRAWLMLAAAAVLLMNVLLWAWPMPAHAAPPLPRAVQAYVERRALCRHWRGEEPYDAARGGEIRRRAHAACAGLREERRRLRLRHRGDARVLRALRLDDAS